MDGDELFERFRREILGGKVTFVTLALNTLMLHIDGEPGEGRGLTFWFDPSWHVTAPEGILAGSHQAQGEGDEGPTDEELERVLEPLVEKLVGREVTEIQIDSRSRDLTVTVAGLYQVRTFASNPRKENSWHIRENSTRLTLFASPGVWRIKTSAPRPGSP